MAVMTDVRSVAGNTVVENVLSGKLHEFLQEDSIVRLAAVASAVGIRVTLLVGGEAVIQDQEISGANRFPVEPDDIVAEGAGVGGDRLVLSLRNTTAGALTVNSKLTTEPM